MKLTFWGFERVGMAKTAVSHPRLLKSGAILLPLQKQSRREASLGGMCLGAINVV